MQEDRLGLDADGNSPECGRAQRWARSKHRPAPRRRQTIQTPRVQTAAGRKADRTTSGLLDDPPAPASRTTRSISTGMDLWGGPNRRAARCRGAFSPLPGHGFSGAGASELASRPACYASRY